MKEASLQQWNQHYNRSKAALSYPDENLIRMLKPFLTQQQEITNLRFLDLGCGSGRHLLTLQELGAQHICGSDYSQNAIDLCKELGNFELVQACNSNLPFADQSFDIIIAWGSLHYNCKEETQKSYQEIKRILKPGGNLFGTLRSDFDTFFERDEEIEDNTWQITNKDLSNSLVSFFSEEELTTNLKIFNSFSYGLMERSILGDINKKISHWYYKAIK